MSDSEWDVVVVGGGSAGLSAALMLVRARRRVLVLDGGAPRNRFAEHMHGVLGRDGTSPVALLEDGRREIERYGAVVRPEIAVEAVRDETGLTVVLESGERARTRRLLVATGLRDELPAIEGLAEQWGKGAVTCPYCDGWEVRDRRIGVLATGPLSPHHAQLLRQWSEAITYFTQQSAQLDDEQRRQMAARGIVIDDRPLRKVVSDNGVLRGIETADGAFVALDSIFLGPRLVPQDELLTSLGTERTENPTGTWVVVDAMGKTSVPGVWAAGNVVNPQANVPVSMGAGAMAGGGINADLVAEDIEQAVARTPVDAGLREASPA